MLGVGQKRGHALDFRGCLIDSRVLRLVGLVAVAFVRCVDVSVVLAICFAFLEHALEELHHLSWRYSD